jgi:PAS domain S-box-containing protein
VPEERGILEQLARLAVPLVADWVVLYAVAEHGEGYALGVMHADPRRTELLHELVRQSRVEKGRPFLARLVKGSAEEPVTRDLTEETLRAEFADESTIALLETLAPTSMASAPLRAHGRTIGAVSLFVGGSRQRYAPSDLPRLSEFAGFAALAVDNQRLQGDAERETEERRIAESALEQARSLHQATIESTADGILVVDRAGRIVSYNRRYLELWGIPEAVVHAGDDEAALALAAGQLRDAEMFVRRVQELYASPEAESFDMYELRDGRIIERYSRPERIGSEIVGRVWSFRDATERIRLTRRTQLLLDVSTVLARSLDYREALRAIARLLVPSLAEWCQVALLREDGQLRIAAESWAGMDVAAGDARTPDRSSIPPDSPHPVAVAFRAGEPVLMEDVPAEVAWGPAGAHGEGGRPETAGPREVLAIPLAARGRMLGAMAFGVPAQLEPGKAAGDMELMGELARRSALAIDNAQLYEAAILANQAKADFLAVMSHELRTPLTAIIGYTELLADGIFGQVSELQRAQLGRVDNSARHLLHLIETILGFARVEAGREQVQLELCDLSSIAAEVVMLLHPAATKRGLTLRTELHPDMGLVRSDPGKVRQVLINLLSNAIKFTERGEVLLTVFRERGDLFLRVTDTGIGIASEHLDRIFDPFWQVEQARTRRVSGTGLGLGVTRHLARMLGGEVYVTSEPGVGSTFTVRLPDPPPYG